MPPSEMKNAKIYKLVSDKTDEVYIGSCLIELERRLSGHKNSHNSCVSKKMFVDNAIVRIELLEALPDCKSRVEMRLRELHYFNTIKCININRPYLSEDDLKEWQRNHYIDNQTQRLEYQKIYDDANRERISEYQKVWRDNNRERISEYRKERRDKRKQPLRKVEPNTGVEGASPLAKLAVPPQAEAVQPQ